MSTKVVEGEITRDEYKQADKHLETNLTEQYDLERDEYDNTEDVLMEVSETIQTELKNYCSDNALPLCENLSAYSVMSFIEEELEIYK
jgi:hypothetical protein